MSSLFARSARTLIVLVAAAIALVGGSGLTEAAAADNSAGSSVSTATPGSRTDSIVLDGIRHRLMSSEQPKPGYVRNAYLPAGQQLGSYRRMVLVEAVTGPSVAEAVQVQLDFLNRRKTTDPLVNVDLRTDPQTGEALLDFTVSGTSADGREIVEWNAYRYLPVSQGGVRGVQLFGLSLRAYDGDRLAFAHHLSQTRPREIAAVGAARIPRIVLPY